MNFAQQINSTMYSIDCHDLGRKKRTGCYVLMDGNSATLIETSASPSIPYILQGLNELSIDLEQISRIIVTHIHLDHAGGAGLLLQQCPNATLIVHPKGAHHLHEPSRLIAGARAVYGEDFDSLFKPIVPIPENRIKTADHGEHLVLAGRTLTFYHTPGHANHHISIYDSFSKGIFTGDTCGIFYQEGQKEALVLPTTSPNQFDPDAMLKSIDLYEDLKAEVLYFGHFGACDTPSEAYAQMRHYVPLFVECGKKAQSQTSVMSDQLVLLQSLLFELISPRLKEMGITRSDSLFSLLELDFKVSAMGIMDMLSKKRH
ncbi:MBL fold metallo-hydrolase [Bacillus sp. 1P06AnD]|uniref:MBL fold metallo-hydrolase n=1 Tax=Bacillus sp. 1P06AnD TaxID=3132208 RepID=UPI00399F3AAC